jgi:hypothetical protein
MRTASAITTVRAAGTPNDVPNRDDGLELPGFTPDEGVDQLLDMGREGGPARVAVRETIEHIHDRRGCSCGIGWCG